jgi:ABC-2 type transport system permease protein
VIRDADGTQALLRLAVRRDRIMIPVWIVALVALTWAQAAAIVSTYGTTQAQLAYAKTAASSVPARMFGSVDGATTGSVMMVEIYVFMAILIGLMHSMLVVRHTRQNEETGRLELVRSAVVGRHASLAAALLLALSTSVVLVILLAGSLVFAGDLPVYGSVLMALGWGGVGLTFAGIAAVTAQLAPGARMANGLAGIALGVAFVLRMVGDVAGDVSSDELAVAVAWPSWLSPIGWTQLAYPFGAQQWWALLPYALVPVVLVAVAFVLSSRRDVGRGLLREPHGRARATRWLASPTMLALRLDRGIILGWAFGIVSMGAIGGVFVREVETMLAGNDEAREMFELLGGSDVLVEAYLAIMIAYLALFAAAFAIQLALRMRGEERGPGEALLATGISRVRWMSSHLLVAAVVSSVVLMLGCATMYVAALLTGYELTAMPIVEGTLAQLPAVLMFVGASALGFGVGNRWAAWAGWGLFAVSVVVLFGEILDLPEWVLQVSPFTHVPLVPAEDVEAGPLVGLTLVAIAATALGLTRFARRNIDTGA